MSSSASTRRHIFSGILILIALGIIAVAEFIALVFAIQENKMGEVWVSLAVQGIPAAVTIIAVILLMVFMFAACVTRGGKVVYAIAFLLFTALNGLSLYTQITTMVNISTEGLMKAMIFPLAMNLFGFLANLLLAIDGFTGFRMRVLSIILVIMRQAVIVISIINWITMISQYQRAGLQAYIASGASGIGLSLMNIGVLIFLIRFRRKSR